MSELSECSWVKEGQDPKYAMDCPYYPNDCIEGPDPKCCPYFKEYWQVKESSNKQPLGNIFNEAIKELQSGIDKAMFRLQKGMQEYLTDNIDLPSLFKMLQRMGVSDMMGMGGAPIPGLDYYKILGLDKTASNTEVKERYKIIINKLHPDRAGEEITFLVSLVNVAYGIICKERGI